MFEIVAASKLEKKTRKSVFRFETTPEWAAMKAVLQKGLKPKQGAQITLTPEDLEKYGITNGRTVARFVKKYLSDNHLPYGFKTHNKEGRRFVQVFWEKQGHMLCSRCKTLPCRKAQK